MLCGSTAAKLRSLCESILGYVWWFFDHYVVVIERNVSRTYTVRLGFGERLPFYGRIVCNKNIYPDRFWSGRYRAVSYNGNCAAGSSACL